MSGRKTTNPFGDAPGPERRGAPLPLVTQPMIAVDGEGGGAELATRVDPAMQAVFSKPTTLSPPIAVSRTSTIAQPSLAPGAAPPEVGLTQHHLPDNERPDGRLTLVLDPDSERAAAFRVLRHHLLEIGRPQVVIVSSPVAGDGKTTVALNLALALAECGRAKVLLAETHVRRPQLANVFKVNPPWCFAEQLAAHRHQPMLPWSLVEIPSMWLHVAAINPRIEKTQLLDAPAFGIAMERLRLAGYEHIVIDAPSVLGSADVNLMADAADAVVFALRARRSNSRDLRKAIDQLGASKVAGTVLISG